MPSIGPSGHFYEKIHKNTPVVPPSPATSREIAANPSRARKKPSQSHVNSRQTLVNAHTSAPVPVRRHHSPSSTSHESRFRQSHRNSRQTLVNAHTSAPMPSRTTRILKIPINPANPAPDKRTQTLNNTRQTLVDAHTSAPTPSRTARILKIPINPANPAPNTRQTLVNSRPSLIQAHLCHRGQPES